MMTISDVIAELEGILEENGDLPVLVSGYEGDYDEPDSIKIVEVADKGEAEKEETWWYGQYEDSETARPELPRFDVVAIER